MAVQRIWFVHTPDGTIAVADRERLAIGYGGIAPTTFVHVYREAFKIVHGTVQAAKALLQ
jgi:hypothetical protein